MRRDFLRTSIGVQVVAIGIVAIVLSLQLALQDIWILITGKLVVLTGLRGAWYLICAGVAALFSAFTVFIWRPGFPRVVIGLFSVAMVSHIIEQFVSLPERPLRILALCRVGVTLGLIFLYMSYLRMQRSKAPDESNN
jgi:hypothetical protein